MTKARMRAWFAAPVLLFAMISTSDSQETPPRAGVFAAIYQRGPAWQAGKSPFEQSGIREHTAHFKNLGNKLIAAAPFSTDPADPIVGMVLRFANTEDEAKSWVSVDPAVVNGVMTVRVYRWWIGELRGCSERP